MSKKKKAKQVTLVVLWLTLNVMTETGQNNFSFLYNKIRRISH